MPALSNARGRRRNPPGRKATTILLGRGRGQWLHGNTVRWGRGPRPPLGLLKSVTGGGRKKAYRR